MKESTILKDISVSDLKSSNVGVFYEKDGELITYSTGCCLGSWYNGFYKLPMSSGFKNSGRPYALALHPRSISDFEFLKGCLPAGTHKFVHRANESPTIIIPDDSLCGKTVAVLYQTLRQESERFHLVREPLMDYLCDWAGEDSEKRRWVLALLEGVGVGGHNIYLANVLEQFLYCLLCDELYGLGQKEYETGAVSNHGAEGYQGWAFDGTLFKDFTLGETIKASLRGYCVEVQNITYSKYKKVRPRLDPSVPNPGRVRAGNLLIRGDKAKWGVSTDFYEELYGLFGDTIKQAKEELGAAATREEREGAISRLLVGLGRD